ncbi:MAG: putative Ig domain-containing protein, partial [Rhodocyclales bacterium]|nr:putative Ig domain-containing protein [Rhodocyclales bacterium]
GAGADKLYGDGSSTTLLEEDGNDVLAGGEGDDLLLGQGGSDELFGGEGDDELYGDADETPEHKQGDDRLEGGAGNDTLLGYGGQDELYGGDGRDWLEGNAGDDLLEGGEGDDTLVAGAGNDRLAGGRGADLMVGGEGDDELDGGADNDELQGGDGGDRLTGGGGGDALFGETGDDFLEGGAGSDELIGGEGNDTYRYEAADGVDLIDDTQGNNALRLGGGLDVSDVSLFRANSEGQDLLLKFSETDEIYIVNGFLGAINRFEFEGGETLDLAQLIARTFRGSLNLWRGTPGNDELVGGSGDDRLEGGAGNDLLRGGTGNDTYRFNAGDGVDTVDDRKGRNVVSFGPGITADSLSVSTYRESWTWYQNLMITYGPNRDIVTVKDGAFGAVAEYRFDDGQVLTIDQLMARISTNLTLYGRSGDETMYAGQGADQLYAGPGNDALHGQGGPDKLYGEAGDDRLYGGEGRDLLDGGEGNDELAGGAGNDYLAGGVGNDVYALDAGDGQDAIVDGTGTNAIRFGEGVAPDSVRASVRQYIDGGTTLRLDYGTAGDSIEIADGLLGRFREVRLADGTILSQEALAVDLPALNLRGKDEADRIVGGNQADILDGGAGDDEIVGQGGDDAISGGRGTDRLEGGTGNDAYLMTWGMGADTVEDDGGTIRLAGLSPQDLTLEREGDDLVVGIRGAQDRMLIRDYAAHAQAWFVQAEGAAPVQVEQAMTEAAPPTGVEGWWALFRDRLRYAYYGQLAADGYSPGADGKWHKYQTHADWAGSTTWHNIAIYQETPRESDAAEISRTTTEEELQQRYSSSSTQVRIGQLDLTGRTGSFAADSGSTAPEFHSYMEDTEAAYRYPSGSTVVQVVKDGFVIGAWVYPSSYFSSGGTLDSLNAAGYRPSYSTVPFYNYDYTHTRTTEILRGGDGDNHITGHGQMLIDGGGGNDRIEANIWWTSGNIYDGNPVGSLLYGNAGNDELIGSKKDDVLIGGAGQDSLDGGDGADEYVLENEAGGDLIVDRGDTAPPNGYWYGDDYPATATAMDTLVFPEEVSVADLRFSWSEELISLPNAERAHNGSWLGGEPESVQRLTPVLTIEWGDSNRVRVVMPSAYFPGAGIERFLFSNGTELTRDQLLALAPTQDLDVDGGANTVSAQGALFAAAGDDVVSGSSGSDWLIAGDGNDRIDGGDGEDTITGGRGADVLEGGAGGDLLGYGGEEFFGAGNTYRGGTGDDRLLGSISQDFYLFDLGDGNDFVTDYYWDDWYERDFGEYTDVYYGGQAYFEHIGAGADFDRWNVQRVYRGLDVVRFGAGIRPEDIDVVSGAYGGSWLQHVNGRDSIAFGSDRMLDRIEFDDGTVWAWGNTAPILAEPMADQAGQEDVAFSYSVPAGAFTDGDAGDVLTYAASLSDGTPLPDWLAFDPATRAFSGTPGAGSAGTLSVRVTATDGSGLSVADTFDIVVAADRTVAGTAGDDVLAGSTGRDRLAGGPGADRLSGGAGDDTYVFNAGDGVDTVADTGGTDTVEFGPGITPEALSLGLGSLLLRVGSYGDAIHIEGFDPGDPTGSRVIEKFKFADGTEFTYEQLLARGFDIAGGAAQDTLCGTAVTDRIEGREGDDRIEGGRGDDRLAGGDGQDTYVLDAGDGTDVIVDAAENGVGNVIEFGAGVNPSDLRVDREGTSVTLRYGADGDEVRIPGYDRSGRNGSAVIEAVRFADGSQVAFAQLANLAPTVSAAIADQAAVEDQPFSLQVPADLCADPDGDPLQFSATLADGSPLPAWLAFDPATRTFSGTPANGDVGNLSIRLTASDPYGAAAGTTFGLTIANTNDAPMVAAGIADRAATEDAPFSLAVPDDAFADVDAGDSYELSASLANGDPLPGWLAFDPATRGFSGTPTNDDVGTLSVQATATDAGGLAASTVFAIAVANVNDAPFATGTIASQAAVDGSAYRFQLPADLFGDVDRGDRLSLSIVQADGSQLPAWLAFDPATGELAGMPAFADVGTLGLQAVATDSGGASVAIPFTLQVSRMPNRNLVGTEGADTLLGGSGDDTLSGGRGADLLLGGEGADAFSLSADGRWRGHEGIRVADHPGDPGSNRFIPFAGRSASHDVMDGGGGFDTLVGTSDDDVVLLDDSENPSPLADGPRLVSIEEIRMGAGKDIVNLASERYGYGDVAVEGEDGDDVLWSSGGNDLLTGGAGDDRLAAGAGVDVLEGGTGKDELSDDGGNGLYAGGEGDDTLQAAAGNGLFIGGAGKDTITTGAGANIIAFNAGDGHDTVEAPAGAANTVSLGGGIRYADLAFRRSGHDLVLETGKDDRITFEDWYGSAPRRGVANLQVVAEAMAEFDAGSADPLLGKKVQSFDFQGLVEAFDAQRAARPGVSRWALTEALLEFHLSGSDSEALGGDLAYQYGRNGSLAGTGLGAAQDVLSDPRFGAAPQALRPLSGLQEGMLRLS